ESEEEAQTLTMEPETLVAILIIAFGTVLLGAAAAAETALERASDVRIHALAARGDWRAVRIAGTVDKPREFLGPLTTGRVAFASIVVSTFAYLGAGEYGPWRGAFAIGLVGGAYVAMVQMTVGLLAARRPEYAALRLSGVALVMGWVFGGPAFVLSLPSRVLARMLRIVPFDLGPRDDDILSLVEREEAQGGVEEQERRMIRGIIALEDKTVREIMVPRIDMGAVDIEAGPEAVVAMIVERGFSRIPVYRENIDDIVGVVYAKDMLRALSNGKGETTLAELLREPVYIPESKRLDDLLTEMRGSRTHLAIVVDEYGGTAGIVTIEDLLEEIVGEIEDEYDVSRPMAERISENEAVVDAGASTDVLHDLFNYGVDSEEFETIGGFVIHELGRVPTVGDEVAVDGLTLRVLSMSGRRIRRLRVSRVAREERDEGAAGRPS
ncbi:MAG: hemolysin family protein, partial [Dehalococcoidia bacterium]